MPYSGWGKRRNRYRYVMICGLRAIIRKLGIFERPCDGKPKHYHHVFSKLKLCVTGSKHAAQSWQDTLRPALAEIGFARDVDHLSVFYITTLKLVVLPTLGLA